MVHFVSGRIVSLIIHKGSLTTLSTHYVDRSSILVVPIPLLFDRIGSRNVIPRRSLDCIFQQYPSILGVPNLIITPSYISSFDYHNLNK